MESRSRPEEKILGASGARVKHHVGNVGQALRQLFGESEPRISPPSAGLSRFHHVGRLRPDRGGGIRGCSKECPGLSAKQAGAAHVSPYHGLGPHDVGV
jgi:hypothetical protein